MTTVTRNCEYCGEPFTPTSGPMAARQRFCSTKHRVYASRNSKHPNTTRNTTPVTQASDSSAALRSENARLRDEVDRLTARAMQAEGQVTRAQAVEANARRVLKNKAIFTKAQFDTIRACLHPDSRLSVSDAKLAKAFAAVNEAKDFLT